MRLQTPQSAAMDNIRKNILEYKQAVDIYVTSIHKHNHPPMTGIVKTCSYCKTFGNLFEHGVVPLKENAMLRAHVMCLNDT